MVQQPAPRRKVFISYHHEDQAYKDEFVRAMDNDFVDKSVEDGDIDDTNIATDTIRQKIRDEFIADATVTLVLIGPCTWQRKHVDWEIGSSLRDTEKNPRCGLLGLWLPNHPDFGKKNFHPNLIPPRLADNLNGDNSFAKIYDWKRLDPNGRNIIRNWIHTAFLRRDKQPNPNNGRPQFGRNRSGDCRAGWKD